jgi:predicted site-specific integrase-resolvase
MTNQEQYLSEKCLAKKWGISHRTLQRWRWLNVGPAYIRIGGRVRYTQENIKSFEEENSHLQKAKDVPVLDCSPEIIAGGSHE